MTMILAAMFEILFCFLAEMLLNVVLVLAMGAFTLLMEIASYVIASALIDGTLTLLGRLWDIGLAWIVRAGSEVLR